MVCGVHPEDGEGPADHVGALLEPTRLDHAPNPGRHCIYRVKKHNNTCSF